MSVWARPRVIRMLVGLSSSITRRRVCVIAFWSCTIVAFYSAAPAHAGGGIGSAWVENHTYESITINWSNPNEIDYRQCAPYDYKICYKVLGDDDAELACGSGGSVVTTTSKPVQRTGLSASTEYKFKVFVKAEKKNVWGNWKNCEFRKVGTLDQSTDAGRGPMRGIPEIVDRNVA